MVVSHEQGAPTPDRRPSTGLSSTGLEREPHTSAPSDRVSLDWWQTPSIAPTARLLVDGDDHREALRAVASGWPSVNVIAQLAAEPWNPHDRHAVMVLLDGFKVGHLPAERDPRYTALVKHLARTQGPVRVRARITGGTDDPWGVLIDAAPECYDERHDFCTGSRIETVEGTAQHRGLLEQLAARPVVPVELGLVEPGLLGTVAVPLKPVVTVAVDSTVIGRLERSVARQYFPLVRAAIARGVSPTCRGQVHHDPGSGPQLRVALTPDPGALADISA